MYDKVQLLLFAAVVLAGGLQGAQPASPVAGYDVAAYVWPAYQPEPRWAELGIFKAGKGLVRREHAEGISKTDTGEFVERVDRGFVS